MTRAELVSTDPDTPHLWLVSEWDSTGSRLLPSGVEQRTDGELEALADSLPTPVEMGAGSIEYRRLTGVFERPIRRCLVRLDLPEKGLVWQRLDGGVR